MLHHAVSGEGTPIHSRALSDKTQWSSQPASAGASLWEESRHGAPTMGTLWDITLSITLPHPNTSAPVPAEQHHPLSQPDISQA